MDTPFGMELNAVKKMLNLLDQSTGDFYFIYDYQKDMAHFSENIKFASDIFNFTKTICTLKEWRQGVDAHDIHRMTKKMDELISKQSSTYNLNYRVRNKKGRSTWINSCGKMFYGEKGQPCYVIGRLSSIDPSKTAGRFSNKNLKKEIKSILKSLQPGYLLLIGVDELKTINMKYGRDFGDAVLNDVAQVIVDEINHEHLVYRINGDWFAVNIPLISAEDLTAVFERIQERLSGQCTISGGCVSYTDYYVSDEHILLQYAEIALEYSKTHGKKVLSFFSPENYEKKLRDLELREELKRSIDHGFKGFEIYYQPQVYGENYSLYGAEALLRFHSIRGEHISPEEFIPALEQSDLIYPVGLWVLEESLKTCRKWREKIPEFHISVNMSYHQLEQEAIEEDVLDLVKGSGIPGNALTIEVTESMQLSNYPQLNRYFRRWKKLGIEISVDDFGTGYSSLARLSEMAVDEIKIDRCFIREIQNSAYNFRLISNIVQLADSSQIRVCCEGVETLRELKALNELHPSLLQGFLFGHPCCADEFEKQYINSGKTKDNIFSIPSETVGLEENASADVCSEQEISSLILNAEDDVFYLSDQETYQLYYLNPAGKKLFGVKDYYGKKCYKVLHGRDEPCDFCNNPSLRKDSFYIWEFQNEYCGRHFLLKDKLVNYQGKTARLEVALDITKREYVSQAARDKLTFAEKIFDYIEALPKYSDCKETVNRALAAAGDFYQADRAYLFECDFGKKDRWCNTFEWCAVNITPQKGILQNITSAVLGRWLKYFEQDQAVIILNINPLQEVAPEEWNILKIQGIQRLIAVPIRENNRTIGFVGVDNPRYCINDASQVRILASFILTCIKRERNEKRYQTLLQESNQDLLSALNVGFWTLEIKKTGNGRKMTVNETMKALIGMPELEREEECYHFWESRIRKDDKEKIEKALQTMITTGKLVQVEYIWEHSRKGGQKFRFSGIMLESTGSNFKLKGYCRLL